MNLVFLALASILWQNVSANSDVISLDSKSVQRTVSHRKLVLFGNGKRPPKRGQYIVGFKKNLGDDAIDNALNQAGGKIIGKIRGITSRVVGDISPRTLAQILENDLVDYVEEDGELSLFGVQSEPASWGLDRIDQASLPLDKEYHYERTGFGVSVFVVDTGIRDSHSDIRGRVFCGFSAFENGCKDRVGHGTAVAASVGGKSFGVAKEVELIAVKVVNWRGRGRVSNLLAGIEYVTEQKLANPGSPMIAAIALGSRKSPAINQAVERAINAGVVVVVGAGNNDKVACDFSPGVVEHVITVGATKPNDSRLSNSNYGACVSVFAPGEKILTAGTKGDDSTQLVSGTSIAMAFVTGAAALFLEMTPSLIAPDILRLLRKDATQGAIWDVGVGSPNYLLNIEGKERKPSPSPTRIPTLSPSRQPADQATDLPSQMPSGPSPTARPTKEVSVNPSVSPTSHLTARPTEERSLHPSASPTSQPTTFPIISPTNQPTDPPTHKPSVSSVSLPPTVHPTGIDTGEPTIQYPDLPLFINCGGATASYVSGVDERVWGVDQFYVGGETFELVRAYGRTNDDVLFHTERYGPGTPLVYEIPLPAGSYQVDLLFAEMWFRNIASRVFNVWLEGSLVLDSYDIYAVNDARYKAVEESFEIYVSDGILTVELIGVVENAKLNAIAVTPIGGTAGPTPAFTPTPTLAPTNSTMPTPTAPPSRKPTQLPTLAPSMGGAVFATVLRINAGGANYTDINGDEWQGDDYFVVSDGINFRKANIDRTDDDTLYHSERYGATVSYQIEVPPGDYDVALHFCEMMGELSNARVFNISIAGVVVESNVDLFTEAGLRRVPIVKSFYLEDVTSLIEIELEASIGLAQISAIEIIESLPHLSHSVPGLPYVAVDRDGSGSGAFLADGSNSHSHAFGAKIISWRWFVTGEQVGAGETATIALPVGSHALWLLAEDDKGNTDFVDTAVIVKPFGFPFLDSLTPDSGSIGNISDTITIAGVGFDFPADKIIVHFGPLELSGSDITVVDANTVVLNTVPDVRSTSGPVYVAIETPVGVTERLTYMMSIGDPLVFDIGTIFEVDVPTRVQFGPDGRLYVATYNGMLYKLTLDDSYNVVALVNSTVVADSDLPLMRTILGIAFDPTDTSDHPAVYLSNSVLFHGGSVAWQGMAVNGKVSKVSGENLDTLDDIVTGLPVADLDHSVNGLVFGDNGELYIQNGGNTNAGIPGPLTQNKIQDENYFSGATNIAYLNRPSFDGIIEYDDVGNPISGFDVEVFAPGNRNPFGICLHSNGNLYGTDNGPNKFYGDSSTGCDSTGKRPEEPDELNLLVRDKYYGHPNRKRGEVDSRQCIYHPPSDETTATYEAPLSPVASSTNGIIEFASDHFDGQLRGSLIMSKYLGNLWIAPLDEAGRAVEVANFHPEGGLDVTQAPDGSLVVLQIDRDRILSLTPSDEPSEDLTVKSVFPRRGPLGGGSKLSIYGEHFDEGSLSVTVGGRVCPAVQVVTANKATCVLPEGSGTVDIVLNNGTENATFAAGYRYIESIV